MEFGPFVDVHSREIGLADRLQELYPGIAPLGRGQALDPGELVLLH
ncbi:hypothetical protein OEG86_20760 [Hoeflea alexandrii]|nr:hypothetical protein [Hoeflea alexandrii]MCY0154262.1 hypothetical protein [Hoeflea alexandrii]